MKIENEYIWKDNQKLRCGYTTGSCAAGAVKACMEMLLTGRIPEYVDLMTPKGILLHLKVEEADSKSDSMASCAVRKDGGDDFDMTHGILVYADVTLTKTPGVVIDGGEGVGRVTRKGLDQPVGNAAINSVPRRMIKEAVLEISKKYGYCKGVRITVRVPGGEEIAQKTFNPRLGIVGGISILGTSGIVVPMSEDALIETIRTEIRQKLANGKGTIALVPGNYGETFAGKQYGLKPEQLVTCSNFVGKTLDMALELGAKEIIIIGNIGKLIKLAGGIMNTHSKEADCRLELLAVHAMQSGANINCCQRILECNTTEEALDILEQTGLAQTVMISILKKAEYYMAKRLRDAMKPAVVIFSQDKGLLAASESVEKMISAIKER